MKSIFDFEARCNLWIYDLKIEIPQINAKLKLKIRIFLLFNHLFRKPDTSTRWKRETRRSLGQDSVKIFWLNQKVRRHWVWKIGKNSMIGSFLLNFQVKLKKFGVSVIKKNSFKLGRIRDRANHFRKYSVCQWQRIGNKSSKRSTTN